MALAGTRGIANAAVAEAASATAIKPALINRFIGISSAAHCGNQHKFQGVIFVPTILGDPNLLKSAPTFRSSSHCRFFPNLTAERELFPADAGYRQPNRINGSAMEDTL